MVSEMRERQRADFSAKEFARLAQATKRGDEGGDALLRGVFEALALNVGGLGRKDFLLFMLGAVQRGFLGTAAEVSSLDFDGEMQKEEGERRGDVAFQCLEYVYNEQDMFEKDEIERLASLLYFSEDYYDLLDQLPRSWDSLLGEIRTKLDLHATGERPYAYINT